ncbi:CASP-like protein 2C1 isoform X2 [Sesamum indicum]|uniref:CASP-like protein n=1 Tax=Sesamum indicum TaxID=4182 RepID=A0A6I9SLF6_SESIN|nr:CASP-like protein 2C1 isoform X2 [Sesamum indicum]
MHSSRIETFLRVLSTVLLVLTACLVGFDSQTKVFFYTYARKATFRDLNALYVLVWVDAAAAAYNLIQLFRSFRKDLADNSYTYLRWGTYLLDQAASYVVFAANTAAVQASVLALTGEKSFQWMKLCNRYTRFCIQIGGALACGVIAAILTVIISSISAYALFRLYSPKHFLLLKGR